MKLDPNSEISQFVTFTLGEEIFGVLIHTVEEIIPFPEKITPVPKVPSYFAGMINLRGEVISVIDLKQRLNLPPEQCLETTRILIVAISGIKIGMIVDSVSQVQPIASEEVRPPPAIMRESAAKYIFGSVQQGDAVLLLIDTDEMIDAQDLSSFHQTKEPIKAASAALQVSAYKEKILIGFRLQNENFAIDVHHVEEIIGVPKITKVPEMDHLIEGIFHQRSRTLPVIHLSRCLHIPVAEQTEDTCILIVNDNGLEMGYMVDKITEVFRPAPQDILPPPANISGRSAEQLEGIIKMQQEGNTLVVMALDIEKVLDESEHDHLLELNEGLNDTQESIDKEKTASTLISILKFCVGEETFAIQIPEINEITTMQKMVQVPKSPPFVNGVINLRGDVISIIDLAKLFGNPPKPVSDVSRLVIVEVDEQKSGFQVDQIAGIEHLPETLFETPSGLVHGQSNMFIKGIGRDPKNDELIILLDLHETLIQAEMYDGEWGNLLLSAPEAELPIPPNAS